MQGNLSKLRTWALDHKADDIRGWAIRDLQGRPLGRVAELIVDTDQKHVTEIVLADGRRLPAHDIGVGDRVLTVLPGDANANAEAVNAPGSARSASDKAAQSSDKTAEPGDKAAALAAKAKAAVQAPAGPESRQRATIETDLDDVVVSLVEEEVEFGKRRFEKGNIQVQAHVIERPFEHPLRLRDESVTVERRKVDQPLSLTEAEARLREQTVEVGAITEYPITEKHTRVVEEVVVKKTIEQRPARLSANVRRTSVEVTELDANAHEPKEGTKS